MEDGDEKISGQVGLPVMEELGERRGHGLNKDATVGGAEQASIEQDKQCPDSGNPSFGGNCIIKLLLQI